MQNLISIFEPNHHVVRQDGFESRWIKVLHSGTVNQYTIMLIRQRVCAFQCVGLPQQCTYRIPVPLILPCVLLCP